MTEDITEKLSAELADICGGLQAVRLIGQGSIGTVYECIDSRKRHVAVKVMESSPMVDADVFENIIQAAAATEKIHDTVNVVKVLAAGRTGEIYYIVMEMMQGGTLETIVNDSSVPLSSKLAAAAEIADIIADIHRMGIVHGDLKPENILLSAERRPYLNDFYLYPAGRAGTMPAMPLGTPYYMSPEQAKGAMVTPESDIYSFGVLTYELLTGKMPYISMPDNIQEMIAAVSEEPVHPPSRIVPEISRKLDAVVLHLLEKEPQNRYQNMNRAAADLHACLDNTAVSVPYRKPLLERVYEFFGRKN